MSAGAKPQVTLKLATSLDGRIATASGESQWITGPEARAEGHRLRAEAGAVLVGAGTALADDPELTARGEPAPRRQPVRVVLDTNLRLPSTSRLARTSALGPVVVIGGRGADPGAVEALLNAGAHVEIAPRSADGVDIAAALALLADKWSVRAVLAEGGGGLAGSLIRLGLVDRLEWFRAPILLGAEGRPAIGLSVDKLAEAPRFERLAARALGPDLWESYQRI